MPELAWRSPSRSLSPVRYMLARPIRRIFLAFLWALTLGLLWAESAPAHAQTAPDKFIETVSNRALERIRNDPAIAAGDTARVLRFVDEEIMPHVNFERMTGLAVGRAWRQASPGQQRELIEQFRLLLVRTYSGALSQAADKTVRMRPLRGDAGAAEVLVRSELVGARGDPIQMDYRLERAGQDWKIYDVNVLGIWIVQTYRDQFGQEVSAKGLDGLIASLKERNRQASASPSR